MENNTDTLKKLSSSDKPNNQIKLANAGGTPLPPGQIKCNILKGKTGLSNNMKLLISNPLIVQNVARAEEEASSQPTKLTNQLFIQAANTSAANNINLNNDESLSAATFISVVSLIHFMHFLKSILLLLLSSNARLLFFVF